MASKNNSRLKKKNGISLTENTMGTSQKNSTDDNESNPSSAVTNDDKKVNLGEQMDQILTLLDQRVHGQATNQQVESAVNNVLHAMGTKAPISEERKKPPVHRLSQETRIIQQDTGNYDTDDDEDDDNAQKDSKPAANGTKRKFNESNEVNVFEKGKVHGDSESVNEKKQKSFNSEEYKDIIAQIPMGREAAKMMTTFGDGPHPIPEAIEMALLGTRKTLQMAIMDARKIRRRLQKDFQKAEVTTDPQAFKRQNDKVRKAKRKKKLEQDQKVKGNDENDDEIDRDDKNNGTSVPHAGNDSGFAPQTNNNSGLNSIHDRHRVEAVDPTMVYRALASGSDKLAFNHKCGFHMEELMHLFPEEMRSYQRWTEMHEEYSEKKGSQEDIKEKAAAGGGDDDDEDDEDIDERKSSSSTPPHTPRNEPDGGHLKERAAHFDFRTDRMKDDWYMEYAKVRQGSFLPNTLRVRRSEAEKEWDEVRKKKKGRHFTGSWESMSGRSVRFLHWLGFDPPNLYPPDEEVTHALAFLAYDRLGRIVEKAIFLRNIEREEDAMRNTLEGAETGKSNEHCAPLWELKSGEQLTKEDIERAMEDPDVKPAAVYGTEDPNAGTASIQLYFGPGWEDRLELEMDEFVAATQGQKAGATVSEEEQTFRKQEAEILAKISVPPVGGEESLKKLIAEKKAQEQK